MSNAKDAQAATQNGGVGASGGGATSAAAVNGSSSTAAANVPVTVPSVPQDGTRDANSRLAYVPRDARLMALILQEMGVQDVQPPALMMLLEFSQRYLHEVLQDALVYADHANSAKATSAGVSTLSVDDIQLAIQSRVNHSFTTPPSKDVLLSLASTVNSVPLPPISDKYGVKLPPAQHCLTNVNFSIVPEAPPEDESEEDADADADGDEEDAEVVQGETMETTRQNGDAGNVSKADDEMADVSVDSPAPAARGTKRSLDEDDDYD